MPPVTRARPALNAQGQQVLAAIREAKLGNYFINLMVMNYGPAKPANCVVLEGRCDMAASAAQAVRNLHSRYGIPKAQIEVTAMLGINDVVENVFTPADATALARLVRQEQLGGPALLVAGPGWALCWRGRQPYRLPAAVLNTHSPLAFSKAFDQGLR